MDVGTGDASHGNEAPDAGHSPATATAAPAPEERRRNRRKLLRRMMNGVVIAGSLGGLAWLIATEHGQLASSITGLAHARVRLRTVVFAVICERVSMFSFAGVQVRLLRAGGYELPRWSAIGIVFAGNALSVSVPIAGPGLAAAFTYRQLEHHRIERSTAVFALVVSGVLSTVSLALIVSAGALASGNAVAAVLGLVPILVAAAGIAGALIGLRVPAWRRLLERVAVRGVRVWQRLRRKPGEPPEAVLANVRGQLAALHLSPYQWGRVVLLSFMNWLGDAACLYLSTRAAGLQVPLRDLLLVWSAGLAAGGIGLTPGGVGIVEVALMAAFSGIGMPAAGAAVAVMIYRLISLWLVLLIGWVLYIVLIRARRARRTAAQDRTAQDRTLRTERSGRDVADAQADRVGEGGGDRA